MATINYNIDSGTPPFTASINPAITNNNIHNSTGSYYFTNIPDGDYVITIIDDVGCQSIFNANVNCLTTTTTTPAPTSTTTTSTTPAPTSTTTTSTTTEEIGYGILYNFYAWQGTGNNSITSSDQWSVMNEDDRIEFYYLTYLSSPPLKQNGFWDNNNGTNLYNFNARGAGGREPQTGTFYDFNAECVIWIDRLDNPNYPFAVMRIFDYNWELNTSSEVSFKRNGATIRLRRQLEEGENILQDGTFLDDYIGNNGQTYKTVKIGSSVYIAEPLVETKLRDGTIIQEVSDTTTWLNTTSPALCAPNNNDWSKVYI